MPKVSIITPAYNASGTIGRCIKNIQDQEFYDYEHIIMNDGSDDSTESEVLKISDPRIVYHTQKNAGPAIARNAAVKLAKGDYLLMVDADDILIKDAIRLKCSALENSKAALVLGNMYIARASGIDFYGFMNFKLRAMRHKELLKYFCVEHMTPDVQPMMRRNVFQSLNGYRHAVGEDIDLLIRILLAGHHFEYLDQITGEYLIMGNSASSEEGVSRLFPEKEKRSDDFVTLNRAALAKEFFTSDVKIVISKSISFKDGDIDGIYRQDSISNKSVKLQLGEAAIEILRIVSKNEAIVPILTKTKKSLNMEREDCFRALLAFLQMKLIDLNWD